MNSFAFLFMFFVFFFDSIVSTSSSVILHWCVPPSCTDLHNHTNHHRTTNHQVNKGQKTLHHLTQCSEKKYRVDLTHHNLSSFTSIVLEAASQRRRLCPSEHIFLSKTLRNETIEDIKLFQRPRLPPFYFSYDMFLAVLFSQEMVQAALSAAPDNNGKLVKGDGKKGDGSGGYWFEFGVYRGVSLNMTGIANRYLDLSLDIHGFDTFTGLPDEWVGHMAKGFFSLNGILPPVEQFAHLHQGLIEETFPAFLSNHSCQEKKVVGVNIDCDLFRCTKVALSSLEPCLHPGSILHFHELVQTSVNKNPMEEMKALYEWLQSMEKKKESVSLEMIPVTNTAFEAVSFILR